MTPCPIARAVGCRKCPAFTVYPPPAVIGDLLPDDKTPAPAAKSGSAKRTRQQAR
jgi:hypothetical protein